MIDLEQEAREERLRAQLAEAVERAEALEKAGERLVSTIDFTNVLRRDHACRECYPGGESVRHGFLCAYHGLVAALARPEARTPEPKDVPGAEPERGPIRSHPESGPRKVY